MKEILEYFLLSLDYFASPEKSIYSILTELSPNFTPALINIAIILSIVTWVGLVKYFYDKGIFNNAFNDIQFNKIKYFMSLAPGGLKMWVAFLVVFLWVIIAMNKDLFIVIGLLYLAFAFFIGKIILLFAAFTMGKWGSKNIILCTIIILSAFISSIIINVLSFTAFLSFILLILSAISAVSIIIAYEPEVNLILIIGLILLMILAGLIEGNLYLQKENERWYSEISTFASTFILKYIFGIGFFVGFIYGTLKNNKLKYYS